MRKTVSAESKQVNPEITQCYDNVIHALIFHAQHNQPQSLNQYLSALEQFRIALFIDIKTNQNKALSSKLIEKRMKSLHQMLASYYDLTSEVYSVFAVLDVEFNAVISQAFDQLYSTMPSGITMESLEADLDTEQQQQLTCFTQAQVLKSASMFLLPEPKRKIARTHQLSESQQVDFKRFVTTGICIDSSSLATAQFKQEIRQDLLTIIQHNRRQLQTSTFCLTKRNYRRRLHHLQQARSLLNETRPNSLKSLSQITENLHQSCNRHSSVFSAVMALVLNKLTKTASDVKTLRKKIHRSENSSSRSRYESAKKISGE